MQGDGVATTAVSFTATPVFPYTGLIPQICGMC